MSKTCLKNSKNDLDIEFTKWGIVSRVEDIVFVNKKLYDTRKPLFDRLILHETKHSSNHSKKDFLLDLGIPELDGMRLSYWNFVLTHPKSWTAFLPIKRINGVWVTNPNLAIAWFIFMFFFIFTYSLALKYVRY